MSEEKDGLVEAVKKMQAVLDAAKKLKKTGAEEQAATGKPETG